MQTQPTTPPTGDPLFPFSLDRLRAMPPEKYLEVEQVARALSVAPDTVMRRFRDWPRPFVLRDRSPRNFERRPDGRAKRPFHLWRIQVQAVIMFAEGRVPFEAKVKRSSP